MAFGKKDQRRFRPKTVIKLPMAGVWFELRRMLWLVLEEPQLDG